MTNYYNFRPSDPVAASWPSASVTLPLVLGGRSPCPLTVVRKNTLLPPPRRPSDHASSAAANGEPLDPARGAKRNLTLIPLRAEMTSIQPPLLFLPLTLERAGGR